MDNITEFLKFIQNILWSPPLLIFLVCIGLYFTICLGFLQITRLPLAIKFICTKEKGIEKDTGFISLCQSLSATIGTGNIVGVASAIKAGGAGALFWMILAAFIMMSIKYAEALVSIKYRFVGEDGQIKGGPMYYLEKGLDSKFLAKLFCIFGILVSLISTGTFTQVNAITESVKNTFYMSSTTIVWLITIAVGFVLLKNLYSLSRIAEIAVPFITIFYIVGSVIIIATNIRSLPFALETIFYSAFSTQAIKGGAMGTSIMLAIRYGVSRGLFTNEAGMGSSTIAEACSSTNSCVRQGLMSMMGTFFDTIILCTLTGLVIVMSGTFYGVTNGAYLVCNAYDWGIPICGEYIVTIGLIFFAFTTIIGWNYYGEQCVIYLWGKHMVLPYKILYVVFIFLTPYLSFNLIWCLADIANALIIIPNLIGIWRLRKIILLETKVFFDNQRKY